LFAAKGVSFSEKVANRTERSGKILNKEEIAGMREVCRVGLIGTEGREERG
jgi:hypothetical protein